MKDGTRDHTIEADSLREHGARTLAPAPSDLDLSLASELGLLETLNVIRAHFDDVVQPPAQERVVLTKNPNNGSPAVGNPAEWRGWPALAIAVLNPNAFAIQVGGSGGSGDPNYPGRGVAINANKLVVLPIADELYSFGTAPANVNAADAIVWAWRFATPLAPAVYAL